MLKEGHEIGNHTMNHLYANNSSDGKFKNDILEGENILKNG